MYIILFCQSKTARAATPSWAAAASSLSPARPREIPVARPSPLATQAPKDCLVLQFKMSWLEVSDWWKSQRTWREAMCVLASRLHLFSTHPPLLSMAIDLMYLVTTFLRVEFAFPTFLIRAVKLQLSCDLLHIQQTLCSAFNGRASQGHLLTYTKP